MSLILSGTDGLSDVDGSASTPAIRGTDANTGIFFPAADTIAFSEGGTEVARFDSSGNLGIGTSSPTDNLYISRATNSAGGISVVNTNNAQASQIAQLYLQGGDNAYAQIKLQASSVNSSIIGNNDGSLAFLSSTTERMRITSAGTVLLGTTSTSSFDGGFRVFPTNSGGSMQVIISNTGGGTPFLLNTTADSNIIDFRRSSTNVGSISVSATNTAYNTSSDYRLKENIAPMTGALAKVAQLKPVTYIWKSTGETSQGFIAHELQAVVPDCVTGVKDAVDEEGNPVHQGIDTSFLVATLTAAIQELNAKVDAQAITIANQETRLAALEAK
jgi:hypothetical protein